MADRPRLRSLARVLSTRLALILLLALVLSAAVAFLGVRAVLRDQLDRALRSAGELQLSVLATGDPLPAHPGHLSRETFVREVNRFSVVRDSAGRIIAASTPHAVQLPRDQSAFATALAGEPAWATQRWDAGSSRSVYLPAPPGSQPGAAVIQVAAALAPFDAASGVVFAQILGLALLATLAALAGARWLLGSATGIVNAIAAQAAGVQPGIEAPRLAVEGQFLELQGLVGVLNQLLARQHGALERQRQLVADVAHELRTPVTALLGSVEVALRSPRTPEAYQTLLAETREELERLATLVESLLLIDRLEAGTGLTRLEPVDLAALAAEAVGRARLRAGNRRVEVLREEEPRAVADPRVIALVMDHLVDNLVRHTPDGTAARVTVSRAGPEVVFTLDDAGPGVTADLRPRIFDGFVRGDPARTRTAGTGLGLTLAAAAVAAHRGRIAAEPSPMGGLRILITLPASEV